MALHTAPGSRAARGPRQGTAVSLGRDAHPCSGQKCCVGGLSGTAPQLATRAVPLQCLCVTCAPAVHAFARVYVSVHVQGRPQVPGCAESAQPRHVQSGGIGGWVFSGQPFVRVGLM